MPSSTQLTKEFIRDLHISEIIETKPRSGQKQVYIVRINSKTIALKVIQIPDDDRIIRELNIYEEFKEIEGIPCILDIKKYGSELVIFEEYIEGNDLSKITKEYLDNSFKTRQLIHSIAKILEPVWKRNYVHRDLKPQNIIVQKNNKPVVLDFGIARDLDDETITPTGFQPLTWAFGSPEQFFIKKNQISYRTDFFCLGIIAHYLYTGKLPFGSNRNTVADQFMKEQLEFSYDDDKMNEFLNTVLKYRVAERPRNIQSFIKSLGI